MKSQSGCIIILKRDPTQKTFTISLKILSPSMWLFYLRASLSLGNFLNGTIGEASNIFAENSSILSFNKNNTRMVRPNIRCLSEFGYVHSGFSSLSWSTYPMILTMFRIVQPELRIIPGYKNISLKFMYLKIPFFFEIFLSCTTTSILFCLIRMFLITE
jgi:hypothetical protein